MLAGTPSKGLCHLCQVETEDLFKPIRAAVLFIILVIIYEDEVQGLAIASGQAGQSGCLKAKDRLEAGTSFITRIALSPFLVVRVAAAQQNTNPLLPSILRAPEL